MDFEFWQEQRDKGLFGGNAPAPDSENSDNSLAEADTQGDGDSGKGIPPDAPKESLTRASEGDFPSGAGETGENNTETGIYPTVGCLLMPLGGGVPVFRTAQDKADFNENRLRGWEYCPDATPDDVIQYADAGRVFVAGQFARCSDTQRFRHTKATWKGTMLIACDADQIKGIEFDDDGQDKTPLGVEAFVDPNRLFELYPTLPREAYAIGHSLSSLSKPPPHIRCRIYFLLENEIRTETDYKWLLTGLSTVYPIISASRQPAQPVYGNAGKRRIFKDGQVQELDKPFSTKIFGNVLSAERISEIIEIGKQTELQSVKPPEHRQAPASVNTTETTLTDWLSKHRIPILGERDGKYLFGKYLFVDCPFESKHTTDYGAKDTAVWEDETYGFCFHCLHEHCSGKNWQDYRQAVAPRENDTPRRTTYSPTRRRLHRSKQFYGGRR